MQVLPGQPLADPSSWLSRIQHQEIMEPYKVIVKNTDTETLAYTQALLVKPCQRLVTRIETSDKEHFMATSK